MLAVMELMETSNIPGGLRVLRSLVEVPGMGEVVFGAQTLSPKSLEIWSPSSTVNRGYHKYWRQ